MEIWKDIPGYYGKYQVSNEGRVRSLPNCKRRKRSIILKTSPMSNGYLKVRLYKAAVGTGFMVHQLVARLFLGHNPDGNNEVVDHINNIKTDNRVENLQIITNRENVIKSLPVKDLPLGVSKNGNKFAARIRDKKKSFFLGNFTTPKEAHEAYLTKLKELEDND